jgi:predicted  nucleic acid-binding Zn-ribbon protein
MKTYSFIVAVRNSTIIEVNAANFEDAQEIVMNKVHEGGYLTDLCNPSDMEIELDIA